MKRFLVGVLILIPISLSALTYEQIRYQLESYDRKIKSMKADFILKIESVGKNQVQKGEIDFDRTNGTIIRYLEPIKLEYRIRGDHRVELNQHLQKTDRAVNFLPICILPVFLTFTVLKSKKRMVDKLC